VVNLERGLDALLFVELDDLLRQSEEATRELKSISSSLTPVPSIGLKTKVINIEDCIITKGKGRKILSITGRGKLRELVIISPSNNFSICFSIDGETQKYYTFDELESIATYIDTFVAIESNGSYIFHISDCSFQSSIRFWISTGEKIKFNRIMIIYDILE
jgi:hypothetical protein